MLSEAGGSGDPGPQVVAGAFRAGSATVQLPFAVGYPGGEVVGPRKGAAAVDVHASVAADREDVAHAAVFEVAAQARVGAQLTLFEHRDGWRYTAFVTNTTTGALQWLDARHRAHARVEDRIRCAKDTGLRRLPSREFAINQAWCIAAAIAVDLIAWLQLIGLDGDLAKAEPKRLRYRILHTAGRLVRGPTPPLATHPPPPGPGPNRSPPRSTGSRPSPPPADQLSRRPNDRRTQETTPAGATDGPPPCPGTRTTSISSDQCRRAEGADPRREPSRLSSIRSAARTITMQHKQVDIN